MVFEESTAASAVIWDVATNPGGTGGELDDTTFISDGTGHGLELGTNSPTTIDLNNVTFTGYAGTNGSSGNEAIWVRRSAGTVTINVNGGTTPTIRTDGATVNVVNTISQSITDLPDNCEVTWTDLMDPPTQLHHIEDIGVGGTATYNFDGADSGNNVRIIFIPPAGSGFGIDDLETTLPSSNQSFPVRLPEDTVYFNPV